MTVTMNAAAATPFDATVPAASDAEAQRVRSELERLDAELVAIVRRRAELTRRAGLIRKSVSVVTAAHHDEMSVVRHYERHFGRDGVSIALSLLRLGRSGGCLR
ncbi:chorismate mutase [Skermania sp. ID1734]|uniref:chorismate mutase n=1 Tax=Skermania sp. ID1734 TaxID=2597516 RepID=UPI00117D2B0A|nr:chorismate mutase [Skermania sp. ID1734]TSD95611.1 chorismate mutase [Skermania sp. ID1734]